MHAPFRHGCVLDPSRARPHTLPFAAKACNPVFAVGRPIPRFPPGSYCTCARTEYYHHDITLINRGVVVALGPRAPCLPCVTGTTSYSPCNSQLPNPPFPPHPTCYCSTVPIRCLGQVPNFVAISRLNNPPAARLPAPAEPGPATAPLTDDSLLLRPSLPSLFPPLSSAARSSEAPPPAIRSRPRWTLSPGPGSGPGGAPRQGRYMSRFLPSHLFCIRHFYISSASRMTDPLCGMQASPPVNATCDCSTPLGIASLVNFGQMPPHILGKGEAPPVWPLL